MDPFLDRVESLFSDFVSRISHFESISNSPADFERLDKELVAEVAELRKHYEACKRIEALKQEGEALDHKVNNILIELAQFRQELESSPTTPVAASSVAVSTQDLLDYSSKITRFTRQLPGSAEAGILPWPAEDQLRRGMLATLTIQEESAPTESSTSAEEHHTLAMPSTEPHATPVGRSPSAHDAADSAQPSSGTAATAAAAAAAAAAAPSDATRSRPRPKAKISLDLDSDED